MNNGAEMGGQGGNAGGRFEVFNFAPEDLPQPNVLNDGEERLQSPQNVGEQAPDIDSRQIGNAAVNAAQYGEMKAEPEMGAIVDEENVPFAIMEETILSTETGSIEDKDGVTPEEEKRITKIMKTEDLRERAVQQQLEAKRFLVGRYANRAYLKGEK